jgi:hypothetical protein
LSLDLPRFGHQLEAQTKGLDGEEPCHDHQQHLGKKEKRDQAIPFQKQAEPVNNAHDSKDNIVFTRSIGFEIANYKNHCAGDNHECPHEEGRIRGQKHGKTP